MENGNDLNPISGDFIEDSKRETAHDSASLNFGKQLERNVDTNDLREHVVDALHELQV
ncbi:MAG TPA: hypothetical protein VJ751_03775 [Pyrinomonadaceae bacterium]|nr:hypothetical protein [Pyrinomonadaceae bacterium]